MTLTIVIITGLAEHQTQCQELYMDYLVYPQCKTSYQSHFTGEITETLEDQVSCSKLLS